MRALLAIAGAVAVGALIVYVLRRRRERTFEELRNEVISSGSLLRVGVVRPVFSGMDASSGKAIQTSEAANATLNGSAYLNQRRLTYRPLATRGTPGLEGPTS